MIRRGDVVIVEFPFVTGGAGKNRPALIIQSDRDNQRLSNTIVAMITGNTRFAASEPTQLLVDPSTGEGASSGLRMPSAVKCGNLFTIDQRDILASIGQLSPALMTKVEMCLKAALDLPA